MPSNPGRDAKFTQLSDIQLSDTLGQQLIPVADDIRDLFTEFGLRPYIVRVIRMGWAGGRRGRGAEIVVSAQPILPTPKLINLETLEEIIQPIGLQEVGNVRVEEISGVFTEDDLLGRGPNGEPADPSENVFYEIEFAKPGASDGAGVKRRFFIDKAPFYDATGFMWSIDLARAHEDRKRSGDPG